MFQFTYHTPTKVVFGKGTRQQTGRLVKETGCRRVLIHYGGGSARRSGLLAQIRASLESGEFLMWSWAAWCPIRDFLLYMKGSSFAGEKKVDFLLAVGGGSVIDSCKAIGYGLTNEGDVWDFYDHTRQASACMPVGVVLTIAAAGSEMSNSSVITKDEGMVKRGITMISAGPFLR